MGNTIFKVVLDAGYGEQVIDTHESAPEAFQHMKTLMEKEEARLKEQYDNPFILRNGDTLKALDPRTSETIAHSKCKVVRTKIDNEEA